METVQHMWNLLIDKTMQEFNKENYYKQGGSMWPSYSIYMSGSTYIVTLYLGVCT